MPKKHIIASTSAAATQPLSLLLPARLTEILIALPFFAWVENSKGEIFAQGNARVPRADMARPAPCPRPKTSARRDAGRGTRDARATRTKTTSLQTPWKITTYPLPPIEGCPRQLRLAALVSGANKNDCHARVISALLSLLLGATHHDCPLITPQQRDIHDKLSLGLSYKETAHALGISHNALRVQVLRMRKRLGDKIFPRLRRRLVASKRC